MIWFIAYLMRKLFGWRWPYWLYKQYLLSHHWYQIRRQVILRANYRCERCECVPDRFQIHHRTYARLGFEKLSDLQALCIKCHKEVHHKSL